MTHAEQIATAKEITSMLSNGSQDQDKKAPGSDQQVSSPNSDK